MKESLGYSYNGILDRGEYNNRPKCIIYPYDLVGPIDQKKTTQPPLWGLLPNLPEVFPGVSPSCNARQELAQLHGHDAANSYTIV